MNLGLEHAIDQIPDSGDSGIPGIPDPSVMALRFEWVFLYFGKLLQPQEAVGC